MRNLIIVTILTTVLFSCNNSKELNVQFDNSKGLTTNSVVYINGLKIGEVKNLSLNKDNKVIAKVTLDKELPNDSKFYTSTTRLLGGTDIEIEPGKSKDNFKDGELIIGLNTKSTSIIDTLGSKTLNILNNVSNGLSKQDSILIELRRLNKNLEKMEDKK